MTETVGPVLLLICLLQIKHMFADYFLQTPKMLAGRSNYLHMGRAQHAGLHAVFSALVLSVMGSSVGLLVLLVVLEWLAHFHIDWGKARWSELRGHDPSQAGYWRAAGFDQALHQLTYLAMAWAWASWA